MVQKGSQKGKTQMLRTKNELTLVECLQGDTGNQCRRCAQKGYDCNHTIQHYAQGEMPGLTGSQSDNADGFSSSAQPLTIQWQ